MPPSRPTIPSSSARSATSQSKDARAPACSARAAGTRSCASRSFVAQTARARYANRGGTTLNVVDQVVTEAEQELAKGKKTAAARLLTDAAYRTRDPQEAEAIIKLAEQGRSQAGFFSKGRWDE